MNANRAVAVTWLLTAAISLLSPMQAQASGVGIIKFDGEAHLTAHRCATMEKLTGVGGGCGGLKNRPTGFTFYASSAKKPKKDGNLTSCFGQKTAITGKSWGVIGSFCDINVTGVMGKKALPDGGQSLLGTCENSTGPFTGVIAFYESHSGPKKFSNVVGTFQTKGLTGTIHGSELKKNKSQGGHFNGAITLHPQGVTKGNTDSTDDCTNWVPGVVKDDPQQIGIRGKFSWLQQNQ